MGSFYSTCSISNMTLTHQKTSVLLLSPNHNISFEDHLGMIVSNDRCQTFFSPFGFPIHGEYDDYGYITNIKEVNFTKDGDYAIKVEGNLTIHGVTNKVSTEGVMHVKGGKPNIVGSFKIPIKQYGIKGSYIGDKIASEATIKLNCKY